MSIINIAVYSLFKGINMAIVIFGGQKGGSGKSTHAANNAVWRMKAGRDVLVVDVDPQGSANDFAVQRENYGKEEGLAPLQPPLNCITLTGNSIAKRLLDLKPRYDDIIVDCAGSNSVELRVAMTVADKLVTPCRPARFDTATMASMSQTIADTRIVNAKLQAIAFLNAVSTNPNSKREDRVREFILEYCPEYQLLEPMVPQRVAYFDVAEFGMSLDELPALDNKAIAEAEAIYKEIWA
jgi:chromosome partitioning protein